MFGIIVDEVVEESDQKQVIGSIGVSDQKQIKGSLGTCAQKNKEIYKQ